MAGIVDTDGVQWEHCNQCGRSVKYRDLKFGPIKPGLTPSWPEHKNLDLCAACIDPNHR